MSGPAIQVGQRALVTTDAWFYGPDGRQYRAVYGTIKAVLTAEESLGVRPNGRSTNWYLEIGRMILAGCQVHYVLQCDECDDAPMVPDFSTSPYTEFDRPNSIYRAD